MFRFRNLLAPVLLSFWLILISSTALAETITLRADSWYPYNGDPKSDKPGFMIEIARTIFAEAGYTIDYQLMPWARSIKEAESGRIDGIVGASHGDAPGFVFPDLPLGTTRYEFYTLPTSNWHYSDLKSLDSVKIGCIADYSYGETFDAYRKANQDNPSRIVLTSGDSALEQAIKMLKLKRVDAVVESPDVFSWQIKQMGLMPEEFRTGGTLPESDQIFIAFSPLHEASKRYARLLSEGIARLRASGELAKILARYGVNDWG